MPIQKDLNLVMHHQLLSIVFSIHLPGTLQLHWYFDLDFDYEDETNPYAYGTLPWKTYSGTGIENLVAAILLHYC